MLRAEDGARREAPPLADNEDEHVMFWSIMHKDAKINFDYTKVTSHVSFYLAVFPEWVAVSSLSRAKLLLVYCSQCSRRLKVNAAG